MLICVVHESERVSAAEQSRDTCVIGNEYRVIEDRRSSCERLRRGDAYSARRSYSSLSVGYDFYVGSDAYKRVAYAVETLLIESVGYENGYLPALRTVGLAQHTESRRRRFAGDGL